jgi:signal transduction histidine kinase
LLVDATLPQQINILGMRADMEILGGLSGNLNVAIIRANNRGFLYMNSEALQMFRFNSFEEASTCQRKALFADCDTYQYCLNKQMAYGILINERVLFSRRDKSNFWGSITSRLYHVNGDTYFDEIIVDITDKVVNEHKLAEKSHLLEKVANELDRFVYSASHDLRSPISSMRGLISLCKINSEVFPPYQFLIMMEVCLEKLEVFVNSLVEFSKNSNEPVMVEQINFHKIIWSILEHLKEHPNKNRINMECSVDKNAFINSDFNKLYTVLFQVIKNAFDYVDVSKPRSIVSINVEVLKERVVIEVTDNGIGIDKKCLPNIFQMFFRGTQVSKGSGLGLFIAREAMTKLGATVEVKSELGLGTFINLSIPNDAKFINEQLQIA